ncbi:ABC transporter permease [Clostridium neuense]|uniref:ABC transporter permease n=1 Tax=Clostridium neuense TaxID=1728934 RepID=A0ABW8TNX7_9CLOT
MHIGKITKFKLIVSFSILIVLIIMSNYLNFNVNKNVSNVIEYKSINSASGGITFDELSKVKNKYKDLELTGCKEMTSSVTNKYGVSPQKEMKTEEAIRTKIVLTDENYFDLYPFRMIRGGKLDFLTVKYGSKVAIVSDVLANSLFKSVDVIGSTLNVGNSKYRIVGVYKENKSLLYSAAEDGYERIYVPYTAYSDQDKKDKSFIDIMATRETKNYDEKAINDKLSKALNDKMPLYKSVNYTVSKQIVLQNIKILYFIVGCIVIAFFIKLILKFICEIKLLFKEKLRVSYLKEVILNNKKEILILFSKVFICIVGIATVFNLIKFNLVIQNKYLPSENIFDVSFYRTTIISNIQLNNANENGISNVYNRYLAIVGKTEAFVLLGEVAALAAGVMHLVWALAHCHSEAKENICS